MLTKVWGLSVIITLLLAACASADAAPTPTATIVPLPPEVTAAFTPTAILALPTATDTPGLTTATPNATAETPCANDTTFVEDLTIPDGAQVLPGQTFTKKWRVENAGTCDWGPDYRLVLVSGDSLSAPSEVALFPAKAGSPATLEVTLKAPETPGQYTGRWQARDPQGNLFGAVVFVKIEVIGLPATDTPTP